MKIELIRFKFEWYRVPMNFTLKDGLKTKRKTYQVMHLSKEDLRDSIILN